MVAMDERGLEWPALAMPAASFCDASPAMSTNATLDFWAQKCSTIPAQTPDPPPFMNTTRSFRLG